MLPIDRTSPFDGLYRAPPLGQEECLATELPCTDDIIVPDSPEVQAIYNHAFQNVRGLDSAFLFDQFWQELLDLRPRKDELVLFADTVPALSSDDQQLVTYAEGYFDILQRNHRFEELIECSAKALLNDKPPEGNTNMTGDQYITDDKGATKPQKSLGGGLIDAVVNPVSLFLKAAGGLIMWLLG